ncbi:MAG: hypothetical protein GY940_32325, partial [bacterium]|nr:hypothetical protein [bacterium]
QALDDTKQKLGLDIVSVTSGKLTEIKFEWDPKGRIGHIPLTFKVDPGRKFGKEQTRENNTMQKLIEVSPVLHELQPTEVTQPKKRFFVGDTIPFNVNVKNAGICPEHKMQQKIRIRLKHAKNNRVLGQSAPFSLDTQTSVIVPATWKTKLKDSGKQEVNFSVVTAGFLREQTPPGRTNNSISHSIEILPMPHDLIITSAEILPKKLIDGNPATVKLVVKDHARFPG